MKLKNSLKLSFDGFLTSIQSYLYYTAEKATRSSAQNINVLGESPSEETLRPEDLEIQSRTINIYKIKEFTPTRISWDYSEQYENCARKSSTYDPILIKCVDWDKKSNEVTDLKIPVTNVHRTIRKEIEFNPTDNEYHFKIIEDIIFTGVETNILCGVFTEMKSNSDNVLEEVETEPQERAINLKYEKREKKIMFWFRQKPYNGVAGRIIYQWSIDEGKTWEEINLNDAYQRNLKYFILSSTFQSESTLPYYIHSTKRPSIANSQQEFFHRMKKHMLGEDVLLNLLSDLALIACFDRRNLYKDSSNGSVSYLHDYETNVLLFENQNHRKFHFHHRQFMSFFMVLSCKYIPFSYMAKSSTIADVVYLPTGFVWEKFIAPYSDIQKILDAPNFIVKDISRIMSQWIIYKEKQEAGSRSFDLTTMQGNDPYLMLTTFVKHTYGWHHNIWHIEEWKDTWKAYANRIMVLHQHVFKTFRNEKAIGLFILVAFLKALYDYKNPSSSSDETDKFNLLSIKTCRDIFDDYLDNDSNSTIIKEEFITYFLPNEAGTFIKEIELLKNAIKSPSDKKYEAFIDKNKVYREICSFKRKEELKSSSKSTDPIITEERKKIIETIYKTSADISWATVMGYGLSVAAASTFGVSVGVGWIGLAVAAGLFAHRKEIFDTSKRFKTRIIKDTKRMIDISADTLVSVQKGAVSRIASTVETLHKKMQQLLEETNRELPTESKIKSAPKIYQLYRDGGEFFTSNNIKEENLQIERLYTFIHYMGSFDIYGDMFMETADMDYILKCFDKKQITEMLANIQRVQYSILNRVVYQTYQKNNAIHYIILQNGEQKSYFISFASMDDIQIYVSVESFYDLFLVDFDAVDSVQETDVSLDYFFDISNYIENYIIVYIPSLKEYRIFGHQNNSRKIENRFYTFDDDTFIARELNNPFTINIKKEYLSTLVIKNIVQDSPTQHVLVLENNYKEYTNTFDDPNIEDDNVRYSVFKSRLNRILDHEFHEVNFLRDGDVTSTKYNKRVKYWAFLRSYYHVYDLRLKSVIAVKNDLILQLLEHLGKCSDDVYKQIIQPRISTRKRLKLYIPKETSKKKSRTYKSMFMNPFVTRKIKSISSLRSSSARKSSRRSISK